MSFSFNPSLHMENAGLNFVLESLVAALSDGLNGQHSRDHSSNILESRNTMDETITSGDVISSQFKMANQSSGVSTIKILLDGGRGGAWFCK